MNELRNVALPADLCAAVEKIYADQFHSLSDLLVTVLRVLQEDAAPQADQAEQRLVEERLRELGYL